VPGGGEHAHVDPGLGDDVLGGPAGDPVGLIEPGDLGLERGGQDRDLGVQVLDLGSQQIGQVQHPAQQPGQGGGEERAVQGLFNPGDLGPHPASRQLGQRPRMPCCAGRGQCGLWPGCRWSRSTGAGMARCMTR
jgi:hypothetical protein